MSRSAACEREVVVTIADDETAWTVFTDSARMTKKLLRVAVRWGVSPERMGAGWQFTLPLSAVRFGGPPSARKLAACRRATEASQKARDGSGNRRARPRSEGAGASGVS